MSVGTAVGRSQGCFEKVMSPCPASQKEQVGWAAPRSSRAVDLPPTPGPWV